MLLVNFSWTLAEKVLRILSSIFIGVLFTRFLGAENYGIYSFGLAWVGIVSSISLLGLEHLAIKHFVSTNVDGSYLLKQINRGLFFSGLLFSILSILASIILVSDYNEKLIVIVMSLSLLFQYFYGFNYVIQARSKFNDLAKLNVLQLFLSVSLKLTFIIFKCDLIFFSFLFLADSIINVILYELYSRKFLDHNKVSIGSLRLSTKNLLTQSFPLILSGLLITVFFKVDQFVIKWLLGNHKLGVFSIVIRITEAASIIPFALLQVLSPKILKNNNSKHNQLIFDVTILIAFIIAAFICIFSEWIILFLFGDEFIGANLPLKICIWSVVFSSLGQLNYYITISDNSQITTLIKVSLGLIFNIILCYFFTIKLNIIGTAISTLLSYFFSAFVLLFLFKNQRWQVYYFLKVFNLPLSIFRIISLINNNLISKK